MRKLSPLVFVFPALSLCGCYDSPSELTQELATTHTAVAIQSAADYGTIDDRFADLVDNIPGFGGMYNDDGRLIVNLSGARPERLSPRELAALEALFSDLQLDTGEGTTTRLAHAGTRRVRYNFRQLLGWRRSIQARLSGDDPAFGFDVDDMTNQVVIHVLPNTWTIEDLVTRFPGIPREALRVEVGEPARLAETLRSFNSEPPGGVVIQFSGLGGCTFTTGIEVYPNPDPDNDWGIVASHCSQRTAELDGQGYVWQPYQEATWPPSIHMFGVEWSDPLPFAGVKSCAPGDTCRLADAAIVRTFRSTYQGRVIANGFDVTGRKPWAGVRGQILNDPVSKVGITTGVTSGTVTHICYDEEVEVDGVTYMYLCQTRANVAGAGGDSGSPVYYNASTLTFFAGVLWGVYAVPGQVGPIIYSPYNQMLKSLEAQTGRQVCIHASDPACP